MITTSNQTSPESDRHPENIAKMAPVGIFHADISGNCLYVNERWCEMSGLSKKQSLGRGWQVAIYPDDLQLIEVQAQFILSRQKSYKTELRLQDPQGKITWVLSEAIAEINEDGRIVGYIGTVVDISERHQIEEALRESEERFAIMANSAPVMIWMSGLDKLCNFFNQGWLDFTGRTMAEELGNGWVEGVHPEDRERCIHTYTTAFEHREVFMMEYRLKRFDGQYRWIFDTGTPRFNSDGSFAGYIGSCVDINPRKQVEITLQQRTKQLTRLNTILAKTTTLLQQRNQELDQFAYVASHDLKAPLRAIASLSEWLEEDLADQLPEENQHQMQLLRGRVRRMEALINGLLEYSRIGRVHTELTQVNVDSLLREVIDSLQPPASFQIQIQPKMPTLVTKRVPLQQVFANLIENAIEHHTGVDGRVKISVRDLGKYYEFSVEDDGPGIPVEYHDKVFVIFQTLEPRDRKENTGIGLAIVKKIVETEGGSINLKPVSGPGSTFRFTWPKRSLE
ncbi:PAS/PAC sensor signal transduction histidine kinase [Trichormus variabilis ATCC 29413]|uniref:histidine kinase n=2 Tax=Anabaena variabilis TaxID=264691 RepID=Q3MCV4_TRIV2|nr:MULTISPECIES: PAS domain-containing sensor histidine kinase [Nostocaceae]ABA21182.1 PAS/PAC sensor signal transduction histidine kinase [Trichormus variabilis ATCC 29413]QFZ13423.1 PAS domain-containing sensor histidine kinase [Anabaena sp. YBS01]QHD80656.1 PAS domain S-box protein [Trichormus variabilis 0441]